MSRKGIKKKKKDKVFQKKEEWDGRGEGRNQ